LIDRLLYKKDNDVLKFVVFCTITSILLITMKWLTVASKKPIEISESYWFPHMQKKIYEYIENCLTCLMANDEIRHIDEKAKLICIRRRTNPLRYYKQTILIPYRKLQENINTF